MSADDPTATPGHAVPGRGIVRLSWVGTVVSCVTSIADAALGDGRSHALSAVPGVVMMVAGSAVFIWAFLIAVGRSRTDEIDVAGLYLLTGSAPRSVRTSMLASVAVQATVPLVVAVIRPSTAFAVLAPMWSLGLAGLWGARHGTFGPRRTGSGPSRRAVARDDGPDWSDDDRPDGPREETPGHG